MLEYNFRNEKNRYEYILSISSAIEIVDNNIVQWEVKVGNCWGNSWENWDLKTLGELSKINHRVSKQWR